jgi:hypothetical protein
MKAIYCGDDHVLICSDSSVARWLARRAGDPWCEARRSTCRAGSLGSQASLASLTLTLGLGMSRDSACNPSGQPSRFHNHIPSIGTATPIKFKKWVVISWQVASETGAIRNGNTYVWVCVFGRVDSKSFKKRTHLDTTIAP